MVKPPTETLVVPKGLVPAIHAYLSRSHLPYAEVRLFLDALEAVRPAEPAAPAPEEPLADVDRLDV